MPSVEIDMVSLSPYIKNLVLRLVASSLTCHVPNRDLARRRPLWDCGKEPKYTSDPAFLATSHAISNAESIRQCPIDGGGGESSLGTSLADP